MKFRSRTVGGGLTVPSNSRRVLGVDPYGAGFRSHRVMGFDPAESWVSIPTEAGFRSHRVMGFDPAESWGVDPFGGRVSIPPSRGVSIPTDAGSRAVGFDP